MPSTAPRPLRKRRNQYHHGDLRRALLDEALRTIRQDGVEAVTLRKVGQSLGVSRTALYRHFSDKRALLAGVATEGFRMLRDRLLSSWESGGLGRGGFDAMGVAYVHFAIANSSHYRVMFGGFVDDTARDEELARESSGAFQVLVDSLIALQKTGSVRADNPQWLARFIWATVHGIAMLTIDGRLRQAPAEIDDLIRFALERVYTGIKAT
jgi:AcrR family transcriptional regulator